MSHILFSLKYLYSVPETLLHDGFNMVYETFEQDFGFGMGLILSLVFIGQIDDLDW